MLALLVCVMIADLPGEETGRVAFKTRPEESRVPERFRLAPATFPYRMTQRIDTPGYTVWSVEFPSPVVTTCALVAISPLPLMTNPEPSAPWAPPKRSPPW